MKVTFDQRLDEKKAARQARSAQTWEQKVGLIEQMKEQLGSWKKPSKSSIASKPQA
jgi:hypothetical protein